MTNLQTEQQEREPRAELHHVSEAGLAASVVTPEWEEVRVAAATGREKNVLRLPLQVVGCWRIDDPRFYFDVSFLMPEAREEFAAIGPLREKLPDCPLSVFGHADPVGNDEYNKTLSGRRAAAVYGVLTRDTDKWEYLYSHPHGRDNWGTPVIQFLLQHLGYDPGPVDGIYGPRTTAAVRAFQKASNGMLREDGVAGPKTRKELFAGYMDLLAPGIVVPKTAFLGGGLDPQGKADFQGCGEFNPVLLFSEQENRDYLPESRHEERNTENTPNRRILVYFFRAGTKMTPDNWPCPRASEGTGACRRRLFSDEQARRSFGPERREWAKSRDTFGCRFYHRLVMSSPCERLRGANPMLVQIVNHMGHPVTEKPFTLVVEDCQRTVTTTDSGLIRTLMPRGSTAMEGEGETSVFFGQGYDYYTHDRVPELDSVSPYPFEEAPGSKNGRAESDVLEELTNALSQFFGIQEEAA